MMDKIQKLFSKISYFTFDNYFILNIIQISVHKSIKIIFIFLFLLYSKIIKKNFNESKNIDYAPKISIFLPIYNKEKFLKRSIGSIQRQSLNDIEIISVNDGSTDNSLEILKEFAKKDKRMKIINNDKNHGLLFSRAMGVLYSKGEYLMCLDPDDEFKGHNILKYLYIRAKNLNVEVISFYIFYLPDKIKSSKFSRFNKIIRQPELFELAFNQNGTLKDFYITNKLIKKNLFKNAFNLFKKKIYGEKWNYHEDNIWSILIYKYAKTFVFINKKVYYYYQNKESMMSNRGNLIEIKNLIYKIEMYEIIFENVKEKKYLIAEYLNILLIIESLNLCNKIKDNNDIKNQIINLLTNIYKKYENQILRERIKDFMNKISD